MKSSIYNYKIQVDGIELLYNTVSNKCIPISDDVGKCLSGTKSNPNVESYLTKLNFLVEDDINEEVMVESLYLQRRYSSRVYQLIPNTSLDCNLCCWYCYETHLSKSYMTIEVVHKVIKHIELMAECNHFEILELSFFGGEPMTNYKAIAELLRHVDILSQKYKFKINLTFVTNGTLITQRYISLLSKYPTRFQITIDGGKDCHDQIRKYKNKKGDNGTYTKIIQGLRLMNNASENFTFTVRINYDNRVLNNFETLISDIDFLDRKRTVVSLHKVWQYKSSSDDFNMAIEAVNYVNGHNFVVNTRTLNTIFHCCYADNYNQAVINYDGSVYKCTARNFAKEKPLGYLNSLGVIEWNTPEIYKRMSLEIPEKCKVCKLLPCCPGICSQKKLETADTDSISCPFEENISIDDIILLNIKQQLITKKNGNN